MLSLLSLARPSPVPSFAFLACSREFAEHDDNVVKLGTSEVNSFLPLLGERTKKCTQSKTGSLQPPPPAVQLTSPIHRSHALLKQCSLHCSSHSVSEAGSADPFWAWTSVRHPRTRAGGEATAECDCDACNARHEEGERRLHSETFPPTFEQFRKQSGETAFAEQRSSPPPPPPSLPLPHSLPPRHPSMMIHSTLWRRPRRDHYCAQAHASRDARPSGGLFK